MKKLLILTMVSCLPLMAYATLGESDSSIMRDNRAFASTASLVVTKQLSSQATANNKYNVYYIQSPENIQIKEFSAKGIVFAVAWHGKHNPDLSQLLGSYFAQYKSSKPTTNSLTSRTVNHSDLTVMTYGVIGDFHGVAYIPSLMPDGVTVDDLTR